MIDYAFKSECIREGFDLYARKLKFLDYRRFALQYYGEVIQNNDSYFSDQFLDAIQDSCLSNFENYRKLIEGRKIDHATCERAWRLKKRVCKLLSKGQCLFLTLTFTDSVLSSTSDKTRRVYVTRVLKEFSQYYVANVDFGAKNGREHYHAIVVADSIDYDKWTYGAINGKKIRQTSEPKVLARYISKLTNHAIKETTKRNVLIYSKEN